MIIQQTTHHHIELKSLTQQRYQRLCFLSKAILSDAQHTHARFHYQFEVSMSEDKFFDSLLPRNFTEDIFIEYVDEIILTLF